MNEKKEVILNEALKLFLEHGYENVSLNMIAKKSHVTKGGIYHYFESKEILFFDVLKLLSLEAEIWWSSSVYKKAPFHSMKELLNCVFNSLCEIPDMYENVSGGVMNSKRGYFMLIFDGLKRFPEFNKNMLKSPNESNIVSIVYNCFIYAQKSGEINMELEWDYFYFHLIALIEGSVLLGILDKNINLDQIGPPLIDIFWKGISN